MIGALIGLKALAAGTVCVERLGARIERKHHSGGFARLLGVTVDAADLGLGDFGAGHSAKQLRALLMQIGQVLHVGLLAKFGLRLFEVTENPCRIDTLSLVLLAFALRELNAQLSRLRFGVEGGQIAVDRGELAVDLRDSRFHSV